MQRSRVIRALFDTPHRSAAETGYASEHSGRMWIKRLNETGLVGLGDVPRTERLVPHTDEVRSSLISLALQKPYSLVPRRPAARSRLRGKKVAIIQAYLAPPPRTRVLCLDEAGSLAVKTYPGTEWHGPHHPTVAPAYGRRSKLWVHGVFEPATGEAGIVLTDQRDSAGYILPLEHLITRFPVDRWPMIADNLRPHTSRDGQTALMAWPEIQVLFLHKYAAWLNLIEPW